MGGEKVVVAGRIGQPRWHAQKWKEKEMFFFFRIVERQMVGEVQAHSCR